MTTVETESAFERLIEPHRAALQAHCYRMLGSTADAEDAVQETLLRAWRGFSRFEGRSSLRSWLYRIATNVCLRAIERRPKRVLPVDYGPASDPHDEAAGPLSDPVWLDPYVGLHESYEERESVELAFIAALQHLPPRQRAVLLMRDVLGFSPAEIAQALEATATSVYSMLQRAHATVDERLPERSQQETLQAIGDARLRDLATRYARAWEAGDVPAILALLTDDASFAMPPRPSWYRGRAAIGAFLPRGPLACAPHPRFTPIVANGQLAFAIHDRDGAAHATQVLTLAPDGRIAAITAFLTGP